MKIGEISRFCGISRDTIRYYISLGLLAPRRKKAQYVFSDREIDDLFFIQKLKDMQFSLKSIESVMRLRSTSNWVEPGTIDEYSLMLRATRSELCDRQDRARSSIAMIDGELESLSRRRSPKRSGTGVPIRVLPYLACPRCGKPIHIEQANVSHKYVHSGHLVCECGFSSIIDRGIVVNASRYTAPYDKPDLNRELYRTLCSDLLRIYHTCSGCIAEQLLPLSGAGKIVLEGNINGYFFLYNHFDELPRDFLYVITDKFPETLFMYKELIERLDLDLDILYIADAAFDYPLKSGCVDVCVDFFGTTEHQFYHENTYIEAVAPFLSERATVIGSYMDLDARAQTRKRVREKYPESSSRAYSFDNLTEKLKDLGFEVRSDFVGDLLKTQNAFSFACHVDNEKMRFYTFTADRKPERNKMPEGRAEKDPQAS